jgi:transposase
MYIDNTCGGKDAFEKQSIQQDQLEMVALDQLVPHDHLVRKVEVALGFFFIYDLVKEVYSEVGRPIINPVIHIKLTFIQYTFKGNIRRRQTSKIVERYRQSLFLS